MFSCVYLSVARVSMLLFERRVFTQIKNRGVNKDIRDFKIHYGEALVRRMRPKETGPTTASPAKTRIDLVTVFDAILTSRQTREKLQCFYENIMSNNFRRTAVLKKISIVN